MSEAAASGQDDKSTGVGNKRPMPFDPAIAKAARRCRSLAARRAGDAAQRAINRANAVEEDDEVATLEAQIEQLDALSDEDSAKEYDIVKARFDTLAGEHNSKIAHKGSEAFRFKCAICFDDCKLMGCTGLRILNPCGHGFCAGCIDIHVDVKQMGERPDCPSCRALVVSVITPYF